MDVQFNHQTKIHPSCCPNSLPLKTHVVCFKNKSIYMWPVPATVSLPKGYQPGNLSIRKPPWAGLGTRPGNPACDDKKPRNPGECLGDFQANTTNMTPNFKLESKKNMTPNDPNLILSPGFDACGTSHPKSDLQSHCRSSISWQIRTCSAARSS